ncbi:hypothetical protein GCM10011367_17470 [Marinicauda pacifica]|uniref:Uncharacterized protein n=1 Tax=Marinicauda pacifica TaxID=1133559 RepID=A0A4S2HBV8_9PROT|nr:hypothetical protein [Marinicauda pacifica]TGY93151.1 hypothetical protein E5162_08805 [Marinicauda pacifica]GGE43292.1 hypothetical protein GCM10011367_17470 [Marinicauda pacifica]
MRLGLATGLPAAAADRLAPCLEGMSGPRALLHEAARTGLVLNFTGGRDRHAVRGRVYDTIADLPGAVLGAAAPRLTPQGLRVDGPEDTISLTDLPALGFDPLQPFTLMVEWNLPALTGLQAALTIDDGTTSNRWPQIWAHNAGNAQVFTSSSVGPLQGVLSSTVLQGRSRLAVSLRANSISGSINGGSIIVDPEIDRPVGLANMRLGARASDGYLNGSLAAIAIWTAPLDEGRLEFIAGH